jgi:DNA repair protein RecN (Recombination protein N)
VLEQMRIRGLGVIEDAVLTFAPGFNAVTGETGAGKTMVVTGLGLLFGDRAESGRVRPGAGRAQVEGRLELAESGRAAKRAAEYGAELDAADPAADGGLRRELLINRSVAAAGSSGSRAFLGGQPVPVSVLADLAEDLVEMHGQASQQLLRQPARQRDALDRYAGEPTLSALAEYRTAYNAYKNVCAELEELTTKAAERFREADALRYGLAEIEKVDPRPEEREELAAEIERLGSAEELRTAAARAHEALSAQETSDSAADALTLINHARRSLDAAKDKDPALAALATRLDDVYWQLGEIGTDIAGYLAGIEADPTRLEHAHERVADLDALCRHVGRYLTETAEPGGPSVEQVLAWGEQAALRLAELDGDDGRIAELTQRRDALHEQLGTQADRVSELRAEAAGSFAAAVGEELAALAMPRAKIEVRVKRREEFGPAGRDEVELLLAPHPGAPFLPIAKGASGGELSRVMLAIEVVFAGADPVPTLVFDEIDQGVGGQAAIEVGRRLARLARSSQVIVVTHLPQVAAFADRQLVVAKDSDGGVTSSDVTVVADTDRYTEIARMLSGRSESDSAKDHARELVDAAIAERASYGSGS